ncbi:methylenetetrahydrofolate reductase [Flavimobilis sp. GY10621]|uniref:Methylenetetrahydrofolate reductase n=1 Tax=Flavimobilis rhizosphaerae TaxID=2775421 RepID=A0ABR9DQA4_9MICO|nr:methylenetetrahydrofolate reductase [Flavimobilis rhizosphaerae]MBD9699318.1 methylenetetrahydrofolate reductase [Flavimobilis rhizosphaerae]
MSITSTGGAPARPTVSFELMPPRNPDAAPKFWATARALLAARPDFVSVTYGAAGTDRATTRQVVQTIARETPVLPIAHLTCVAATREHVTEVVREFLDAGIRSFLALRGDPPVGQPDWTPSPGGVNSSEDLIRLLQQVEAVRCGESPASALRGATRPLTIAVATFPGGNLAAGTTPAQEVERLLVKQEAGATFAITQLFYEASTYVDFVERARAAGVTIPILAGILPTTEPRRLHRVAELTGVPAPVRLTAELESLPEDERHAHGMRASIDLARAVLDAGAPGLHVYTFNNAAPALDLLEGVHLGGDAQIASDLAGGPRVGEPLRDVARVDGP